MAKYSLHPERSTLHGSFSKAFDPVLTINSGDSVCFRTLDAGWGLEPFSTSGTRRKFEPRERPRDGKEALALASLVVDLRITQLVNGVREVHAVQCCHMAPLDKIPRIAEILLRRVPQRRNIHP